MKRLALAAFVAVVFPTLGLAQGTVNFGSTDPVNHRILMYWNSSPPAPGTTATLWWSPDNNVPYVQIAGPVAVSSISGKITAGAVVATTGPATPPGASAWFHVEAETPLGWGRTANFLNPTGNPSVAGGPAELTGWNSPLLAGCLDPGWVWITRNPASQFVAAGDALTLSVETWTSCWPYPLLYQWHNSHGAIPGATNSNYVINPVQSNHADTYWVVVSTSFNVRTSAVATVIVLVPGSFAMQTSDDSFGVRTNRFGFNITGPSNLVVVVEASTNLANSNWSRVQTNILTGGSSYFNDAQWTNYPTRYYRLRWP